MPARNNLGEERSILITIVLYKRAPSESQSLCSLLQNLRGQPDLSRHFSLIVYDNSPAPHTCDPGSEIPVFYVHEPSNAGLAAAYNFALANAEERHHRWMLLLDQDTTVHAGFLAELTELVTQLRSQTEIASIVPKLTFESRIVSPLPHFLRQLRRLSPRSAEFTNYEFFGIQKEKLVAYNSGATFRVSALRSIGGFPQAFWLDYLDHAVFHALSAANYCMYVMRAQLSHEPSQGDLRNVPEWRQRNILLAQTLFVKQVGTPLDRLFYRFWVLRYSRVLWLRSPHRKLWKEALFHAILLNAHPDRASKS